MNEIKIKTSYLNNTLLMFLCNFPSHLASNNHLNTYWQLSFFFITIAFTLEITWKQDTTHLSELLHSSGQLKSLSSSQQSLQHSTMQHLLHRVNNIYWASMGALSIPACYLTISHRVLLFFFFCLLLLAYKCRIPKPHLFQFGKPLTSSSLCRQTLPVSSSRLENPRILYCVMF